ncbi:MAG: PIG-L family deacetylase [Bacteroidota bacterium]
MKKHFILLVITCITSFSLFAQAPKSYTSSEISLQLKKLNTVGSVLYIAAHPDDENTRLIAYLANEKCLRTGYLSLTRGDGGQNLIGPEQGVELGVIRTQELLAARRIDGGEQFFTRAYDFGFSKNPEETFTKWNHDSVLSDVVWVIRNFRPDVIITRFATDGSGGHGHHTASAILAEEAFDAAADPKRFPEQLKYVSVWKTRRLFYNSAARFFNPNADLSHLIKLDVGGYNRLLGKSYGEIAAESRSMHKSQGFGSAKQRGESFEYFKPIKGDTTNLKDIFEGIDLTWKRIKESEYLQGSINELINTFNKQNPDSIYIACATTSTSFAHFFYDQRKLSISEKKLSVSEQESMLTTGEQEEFTPYYYLLKLKNNVIQNILGIYLECTSNSYNVSNNDSLTLSLFGVCRADLTYTPPFLTMNENRGSYTNGFNLFYNKSITEKETTLLNKYDGEYDISELYWLKKPIKNNHFDYNYYQLLEEPLDYKLFLFLINEAGLYLNIAPQYKWVDPEKGELYRPLVITPPVMINLTQKSFVFADDKQKEIKVIVKAGKDNINGKVKITLPKGWLVMNEGRYWRIDKHNEKVSNETSSEFTLTKKGEEKIISFFISASNDAKDATIQFVAEVDGKEYAKGIKEIKYDHIPVQTLFPEAEAKLVKVEVKKTFNTVGYIQGAGDEVPASLEQMGYKVVMITDEQLQNGNLNEFPAIVLGVRAFNTNEKLQQYKQRVFDYVKDGGNLIVQYNTNSFAGPLKEQISPVPFKLSRDRVTIEEAPVTFLLPEHPVLNTPNKIKAKDFEGWIQERGIYFATDIDSSFQCPLSMNDPNEKPNKGSLIIAPYGKGNYVYTGLAFFRELPAGVPGAYRLFANILSLKPTK